MTAVSTPPASRRAGASSRAGAATALRLIFGVVMAIDAFLKWLPAYRHSFVSQVPSAQGQPGWLHWWFHFWFKLSTGSPTLFVDLTILAETALAVILLLGISRRVGYIAGALYFFFVWGVGEAFGGPYSGGATDIGTGAMYILLFVALLLFMPAARDDRYALDGSLVERVSWWRHIAEPIGRD